MGDGQIETTDQWRIKYNQDGLVAGIVQDAASGRVLMMGWMNEEALKQTLATRKATFYSRSRKKMWVKGESSGHVQKVLEARVDCDQDVVLLRVDSGGPCCHAGYKSCFYRVMEDGGRLRFADERVFDPDAVYGGT